MQSVKKCLTIAGSDCSGGAGIQADLKTFAAHKCYGASVITSVVAENTSRVISVFNLPADEVEKQLDAVFEDIEIDAVKLGMLPTADIVKSVAKKLSQYKPNHIVCDPVLVATSGDALSDSGIIPAYIEHIFPIVDLLTPNIPEAESFTGDKINDINDMKAAAKKIAALGAKAVLVKGGHLGAGHATDILLYENIPNNEPMLIKAVKIDSPNTHGTGCSLSSAITANLARGFALGGAVFSAKDFITEAITHSYTVGKGHSPVNHFYALWDKKDKAR